MNTETMIRIEQNPKMTAAVERCKAIRPKVRRIDAQTVRVVSQNGAYTVRLVSPRAGLLLASCDCKAGQASKVCYHLAAAMAAPTPAPAPAPMPAPKHSPRPAPAIERETAILIKPQPKEYRVEGWLV